MSGQNDTVLYPKGRPMKHLNMIKRHHLPTLFSLVGLLTGLWLSTQIDRGALGGMLPISTLEIGSIFKTVFKSFGKEALPLALAIIAALIVRHPLPILIDCAWRALLFALSASFLAAQNTPLVFGVYLLLHLAALLCHIAAGVATVEFQKSTGFFPILYFIGILFLLTVIRLLAFTLLL